MIEKIQELLKQIEDFAPKAVAEVEDFRIRILGRKGVLNDLMEEFRSVAPEMKRELGQKLNQVKTLAQERINELKEHFDGASSATSASLEDMTRPAFDEPIGTLHPSSLFHNQICGNFEKLAYSIAEVPEV